MFDTDQIRLSEKQAECILFIEQVYMTDGMIPSADRIAQTFGISASTAKKWLESPQFNTLLTNKGIKTPSSTGVLSAPQLHIANSLLNIDDKRSIREKCQASGITPQQLAVWRKDPTFNAYMQKRAADLFQNSDDIAYMNVVKNVQSGDLQAAKFYFEMTGKYQPAKSRGEVNLEAFVASVIEIIAAEVSDTDTLERIADHLENLLTGKPVVLDQRSTPAAIEAASVEVEDIPIADKMPQWQAGLDGGELKFTLDIGGN